MQSLSFADTPDYAGLRLQLEGALLAETRAVDGERAAEAERAAHAERGREAERAAAAQVKLFFYIYFLIEYLANIYIIIRRLPGSAILPARCRAP